jgi:hypothetical protein
LEKDRIPRERGEEWAQLKREEALLRPRATVQELGEEWNVLRLLGGWYSSPTAEWPELWSLYDDGVLKFVDLRVAAAILGSRGPWNAREGLQRADLQELAGGLTRWGIRRALRRLQRAQIVDLSLDGSVRWRGPDPARLVRHACRELPHPEREVPIPQYLLCELARTRKPALFATVIGHVVRGLWFKGKRIATVGRVCLRWIAKRFGVCERSVRAAHQELVRLGWIVVLSDPQASTEEDRWSGPRFAFNPFGTYPELEPPKPRKQSATVAPAPGVAVAALASTAEPSTPAALALAAARNDFAGGCESDSAGAPGNDFAGAKEYCEIASAVPAEAISKHHGSSEHSCRGSKRGRAREAETAKPNPAPSHGALTSRPQTQSSEKPTVRPRPLLIPHLQPADLLEREPLRAVFAGACAAGLLERVEADWLRVVGIAMAAHRLWRTGQIENPGGYVHSTLRGGTYQRIECCDEQAALARIRHWEAQREGLELGEPNAAVPSAPRAGGSVPARVPGAPHKPAAGACAVEPKPLEQHRESLGEPQVKAALCAALSVLDGRSESERKRLAKQACQLLAPRLQRNDGVRLLNVQEALGAVLSDEERGRCVAALAHAAPWLSRWGAGAKRGRSRMPAARTGHALAPSAQPRSATSAGLVSTAAALAQAGVPRRIERTVQPGPSLSLPQPGAARAAAQRRPSEAAGSAAAGEPRPTASELSREALHAAVPQFGDGALARLERELEAHGEPLHCAAQERALAEALGALSECDAITRGALEQLARRHLQDEQRKGGAIRLLEVYRVLRRVVVGEPLARCGAALLRAAPRRSTAASPTAERDGASPRAAVGRGILTRTQALQTLRELVLCRAEYPLEERKRLGTLAWDRVLEEAARVVITREVVESAVERVLGPAPLARAS